MKAGKYREKSLEELEGLVDELRTDLFNMRVQNTTKELQNVAKIRMTRRQLARVLTVIGQMRQAEGDTSAA